MPEIEGRAPVRLVKTPKWLFFAYLGAWAVLSVGYLLFPVPQWVIVCYGGFSVGLGCAWISAYPEYHMSRLKD